MDKKVLICIGRESGSGGRRIGVSLADKLGIPCMERAELLGQLMNGFPLSVGVSGAHGKTTVTSMISQMLMENGMDIVDGRVFQPPFIKEHIIKKPHIRFFYLLYAFLTEIRVNKLIIYLLILPTPKSGIKPVKSIL